MALARPGTAIPHATSTTARRVTQVASKARPGNFQMQPHADGHIENWNELHFFAPGNNRFIVRMPGNGAGSRIHCGLNYQQVAGGQDNNPNLGLYGRVWVRSGTAQMDAISLPSC